MEFEGTGHIVDGGDHYKLFIDGFNKAYFHLMIPKKKAIAEEMEKLDGKRIKLCIEEGEQVYENGLVGAEVGPGERGWSTMKVKELIKSLSEFDQEKEVYLMFIDEPRPFTENNLDEAELENEITGVMEPAVLIGEP
jgi:hypothetical protein